MTPWMRHKYIFRIFFILLFILMESDNIFNLYVDVISYNSSRTKSVIAFKNFQKVGMPEKRIYETPFIEKNLDEKSDVMLLAYARGGSTYVGHMLGHHKNSFYFYEPLFDEETRHQYCRNGSVCEFNTPSCRPVNTNIMNKYLDQITLVYQCADSVLNGTRQWQRIFGGKKWNRKETRQMHCLRSQLRLAKVLRIAGDLVEHLLVKNSKLKVIYLYRDPRGIINSRIKVPVHASAGAWKDFNTTEDIAFAVCKKMDIDSKNIFDLKEKYPERIFTVAYEAVAKYPLKSARHLFKFLDVNVSKEYQNFISKMGNRSEKEDKIWNSAFRSDGYATAVKWRKELSKKDRKIIDISCRNVYKQLGYPV
ncbi:carbohydrate sulfotransferase 1-like [Mytilus edulis]|uniref:carbohydrate sulfotransferase 1-like n=1 Tax=Mytilus edulis TaxID=6550 RepID=UPI0039EFE530